jgi:serine/threonine protein kinase
MHDNGYVHLDIKPENITIYDVDSNIKAKLIDFGISEKISDINSQIFVGTPGFISPEMINNRVSDYKKCDIYYGDYIDDDNTLLLHLIYASLIPKINGCFIVKINMNKINDKILFLLNLLIDKYDKVYITQCNPLNISCDIYIIGVNKKHNLQNDMSILYDIYANTHNYFETISNNIAVQYINIIKIFSRNIIMNTFFYQFFAYYPKLFNEHKTIITNNIAENNLKHNYTNKFNIEFSKQ